jgi:hypothetical protein
VSCQNTIFLKKNYGTLNGVISIVLAIQPIVSAAFINHKAIPMDNRTFFWRNGW